MTYPRHYGSPEPNWPLLFVTFMVVNQEFLETRHLPQFPRQNAARDSIHYQSA